jgi:hypothetical protein
MAGTSLNVDKKDSVLNAYFYVDVLYNCPPYHRALTLDQYCCSLVLQGQT